MFKKSFFFIVLICFSLNIYAKSVINLYNKALRLYNKGQYPAAFEVAAEAMKAAEKIYKNNNSELAKFQNLLGILYNIENNYNEALILIKKSVDGYINYYGTDNKILAEPLNNLGQTYYNLKRFDDAEAVFQECLSLCNKHFGENSYKTSYPLSNLANVLRDTGRYDESVVLYKKALSIRKNHIGKTAYSLANTLSNLGACYRLKGDFEMAESYALTSVKVLKTLINPAKHDDHVVFANFRKLYVSRHPSLKLNFYMRGLEIIYKYFNVTNSQVIELVNSINLIKRELYYKANKKGIISDDEASKLMTLINEQEKISGIYSLLLITPLRNLSEYYIKNKRYDEALDIFFRIEKIVNKNKEHEKFQELYLMNLSSQGDIFRRKKEYDKAEKYFSEIEDALKKNSMPASVNKGFILAYHAAFCEEKNDIAAAEENYRESLIILKEYFTKDSPKIIELLEKLCDIQDKKKRE